MYFIVKKCCNIGIYMTFDILQNCKGKRIFYRKKMPNYHNLWLFVPVFNIETMTFDFIKIVSRLTYSWQEKNGILYEFVTFYNCRQYWNNDMWFYKICVTIDIFLTKKKCHIIWIRDILKLSSICKGWQIITLICTY